MPKFNFNPSKDIPDLNSKVFLITGGTNGLGYETAVSLASHGPEHILFTGRSQSSADKLLKNVKASYPKVKITFVRCDQTSLASVQEAAKEVMAKTESLDVVIANAGIMAVPPAVTKDGYETQFGTNHLSHALLVKLLLPLLEKTAAQTSDVRVIWLTSLGYGFHPDGGVKFDTIRTDQKSIVWWSSFFSAWTRYGQSKLANLLYARHFSLHHPNITSVSIHPGTAATGLVTNLSWHQRLFVYATAWHLMIPAEQCAWNTQWAATCEKGKLENGAFYEPVGKKGRLIWGGKDEDGEVARRLWEWTERELERWVGS